MRWLFVIFLVAVLTFLIYEVQILYYQSKHLEGELEAAQLRLEDANETHANLKAQLDAYQDPAQAEKELRRRYNYRLPDEKMLIIIPSHASSS